MRRPWVPLPTLPNSSRSAPRHIFHLHVAKMAGRSFMNDAPQWLDMERCPWAADLNFWGHESEIIRRVASNASSARPCFLSYEVNYDATALAYIKATGRAPTVVVLLRPAMSWVVSAAEHWQRPNSPECYPAPCHRNDGLEDLVASGCFWEPGWPRHRDQRHLPHYDDRKCAANAYGYPVFFFRRLLGNVASSRLEQGLDQVERVLEQATLLIDNSLVGLTNAYAASLCVFRHQLGLPTVRECWSLCPKGASPQASSGSRRQRITLADGLSSHHMTNSVARIDSVTNNVSSDSLKTIEKSMAAYSRIYAHATGVFMRRVAAVEAATQRSLLC